MQSLLLVTVPKKWGQNGNRKPTRLMPLFIPVSVLLKENAGQSEEAPQENKVGWLFNVLRIFHSFGDATIALVKGCKI